MSEALEILKSCDAFLEGHFLLSSGRHSSAYCQMAYLQQYPDRCAEVMKIVADKVKEMDVDEMCIRDRPNGDAGVRRWVAWNRWKIPSTIFDVRRVPVRDLQGI